MQGRAAAIALLLLASATAYSAATRIPADFRYTAINTELSFWSRDNYTPTPETRKTTTAAATTLAAQHPSNPNYQAQAARAHAWQAYFTFDPTEEKQQRQQAITYQQQATHLRPAHAATWRELQRFAVAAKTEGPKEDAQSALASLRMTFE